MKYGMFGNTGIRVSEAFLGTMTFGRAVKWGTAPEECVDIIDAYADAGGNVIDTASNYTEGQSEEIIGDALVGRRDRFVISSKFGFTSDPGDPNAGGCHRKNLVGSIERSLRRLRTDYLDVYWTHVWDWHTPIQETLRALDDAMRAGKILSFGMSNAPAWVVSRADALSEVRGWGRPAAIQVPYSLVQRDAERELIPMAQNLGLSVAAYSPLAGGILTGKFGKKDRTTGHGPDRVSSEAETPRVDPARITQYQQAVTAVVTDIAGELAVPPGHVALAWANCRHPNTHLIIGARHREQLADNLAALSLRLDPEHIDRLDAASRIELGYPNNFMERTERLAFGTAL